ALMVFQLCVTAAPFSPIPVTAASLPESQNIAPLLAGDSNEMLTLDEFVNHVSGTDGATLAGIYVSGAFALPVLQQPAGNLAFVSVSDNVVTQFALASQYGSVGLLAHNFLSGKKFFDLKQGMEITLVYGDGNTVRYQIKSVERFRALSPESVNSDFVNMDESGADTLNSTQLFHHIYSAQDNRLVLQTCIAEKSSSSAGRLFVIAEKINN
ncbi:MAG: hypothetical protein LWX83_18585, partial [Anaerolineae bacterium]|nr:hypothetical protein [Anaerolineae bacterium]